MVLTWKCSHCAWALPFIGNGQPLVNRKSDADRTAWCRGGRCV